MKNKQINIYLLPVLSSILLGLSRLDWHLGFLAFFAFIPLISFFDRFTEADYDGRRIRKLLFVTPLLFVIPNFAISLHWLTLVTVPGYFGIWLLYYTYFLGVFTVLKLFWTHLNKYKYVLLICTWMCFEYLSNFGQLRFPWLNLGYSLIEYTYLLQPASLGGVYLLSLVIILINILFLESWKTKKFLKPVIFFVLWLALGLYQYYSITLTDTGKKIGIVQVSIPQDLKWEESFLDSTFIFYEDYSKKCLNQGAELVIWPEAATPVYLLKYYMYQQRITNFTSFHKCDLFLGFPELEPAPPSYPEEFKYYNAATQFNANGTYQKPYYKNVLVPVGERMPFLEIFPFLWKLQFGQANFEYGTECGYFKFDKYTYSPLICFEIAFPEYVQKAAQANPDFFVTITNDAWFYRSVGTYQHGMMTKLRAIETRKMFYRAANTGISMIVDPKGNVLKQSKLFEKTTLTSPLLLSEQKSLYTKYLSYYPVIFPISMGLCLIYALFLKIQSRRKLRAIKNSPKQR